MTNRKLLLILSLTLFFMVGEGLSVRALTITNVSAHPNPFSPNSDGVKDTTTISFVISDKPAELDSVTITFIGVGDVNVPFDTGENKYVWDGRDLNGSYLNDGVYLFKITAQDAYAFGSIIIDTSPPEIKNVFVSLSPFSPNGDGINDVTEISFELSGTNPPETWDNSIGRIRFFVQDSDQSGFLEGSLLSLFPFGVRLKVIPESFSNSTGKTTFTVIGGYKGVLVKSEFTVSPNSGIQVGEELYDTIIGITDVSGATDGDTVRLEWFTGNAVVKIYSSDGKHIQTLTTNPIYNGDRIYHVRWGATNLSDEMYTYRILTEDGTGNVSQRSGQIILSNSTIEILEHRPSLDRISPENKDGQYDGTSIIYNLSKQGIVTVKIFDSGGNLVETLADGVIEESVQSKIWDGKDTVGKGEEATYTYVITAVDTLTSDTVKASENIVVDNKPPQEPPQLDSISPYTNKDSITVSGIAAPDATVQIFVADVLVGEVTASTTTGKFSLADISLSEGKNTITAWALDSVANKCEEPFSLDVILDKKPPVTIGENVPKSWQREDVTINLKALDEGDSGVYATYYTKDGSTPTTSSTKGTKVTLSEDGIYLLRFFSQDNAGNIESVKQAADYIRIDKTSPTLGEEISTKTSFESEEGAFFSAPIVIISGTASDNENGSGVKIVEVQIPPSETWLVVSGTSNWSYTFIPGTVLPSYDLRVRVEDNAGNLSDIITYMVEIDVPEPPIELTATIISGGGIRLTWADQQGKYNIYRANFSEFVPTDSDFLIASEVIGGVWVDYNTTDQTEYYYKIGRGAQDAASCEEISVIADKTPPAIENISATPNPFSPNNDSIDDITTISFTLTEETFVTFRIYAAGEDNFPILEELKWELVGVLPAGDNLVDWDGRDYEGKLVDKGTYVYRFEKAGTLDAAGNMLSQDISGTITCIPVPTLEVKVLEAQPNPFSPDGDKINDVINLNYTLSDFADYVVVNIFDTSGSQQEIIARLKAEAFEYYFDAEAEQWIPVHFKDGIPPGRSDENYYLQPVNPKNPFPPPFGILDKPADAQTVDGYLAAYQEDYPNWRPVPFTIQWNGQSATEQGAYVYSLAAAQSWGISSVRKTGVILLEGLVVVPDDKTPPTVARTYPQGVSIEAYPYTVHSAKLEFVSADLDDAHGTGVDLTASTIRLIGPNGTVPGRQSNDGVDTITWTLNEGLADDGSEDGIYSISVLPVDYSKNQPLNPLIYIFEYNTSVNDRTKPQVIDDEDSPVVLSFGQRIKLEKEKEVTIYPGEGKYIEQIQVTISDVGSGIDLSASVINLLDYTGTVVTAEKKETPIDRFRGKLLLRNIASLTDGRYELRIQPFDNAGNGGEIVEYVFKYKTVDDRKPPKINLDTLAFTSEVSTGAYPYSITLNTEENFINTPIYSLTVDVKDEAPSSGLKLSLESTKIQLLNTSGEEVKGVISYENQSVTYNGTYSATIRLTLEKPLSTDGSDDGEYNAVVWVYDNADPETSSKTSVKFYYDTIVPSVRDIILSPDKSILNDFPEISVDLEDNLKGSGIDENASVVYLRGPDGNRIPLAEKTEVRGEEGTIKIVLKPDQDFIVDGLHTIVAIPKDKAGNEGAKASMSFVLDKQPPSVISMIPERGSSVNGEVSQIWITFYDENGLDFNHPETKLEIVSPPESVISQQVLEGFLVSAEDFDPSDIPGTAQAGDSLLFQLMVPLSINGVYTVRGKVADKAGNLLPELEKITPPPSFTFDDVTPVISSVSVIKSSTGELIELSEGKVISEKFSRVKVDVSDLTSGIDLKRTKIVLKEKGAKGQEGKEAIVPGVLDFELNKETTPSEMLELQWIVNDVQTLEPGVYKVEVEATDMAQNIAKEEITFGISLAPQLEPEILSITPRNKERFNTSISHVIVVVKDNSGTGINFGKSAITVAGPGGSTEDYQSHNSVDTLFWNFANPLANDGSDDGWYTIKINTMDNGGNRVIHTAEFVYDTTEPEILWSQPENGSILNENINSISVRLSDEHAGLDLIGSTISVEHRPSTLQLEGIQQNDGVDTIKLQFVKSPGDGEYEITVYPKDVLGNAPPEPIIYSFRLDTTPPTVTSTEPSDGAILVNTRLFQIKAVLDDEGGSGVNLSKSTITLTGPRGEIAGEKQTKADTEDYPSRIGTGAYPDNTLIFVLDEPLTLNSADDGNYTIEVVAVDEAGNRAESFLSSFVYDTIQPNGPKLSNISVLPVSFSPNGDGASDTTRISFALSKKAKVAINIYNSDFQPVRTLLDYREMNAGENSLIWDGRSDNGAAGDNALTLIDGAYTVMFDSKDADGLTGAMESVNVFIDTQSPVISNLSVSNNPFTPDGDGFADLTSISFSVANSTSQDSVTVVIYDAQSSEIVSPRLPIEPTFAGDGNYLVTWDGSLAKHDGEYIYEVIAKDLAGNKRELSGTIVLDQNAPSISDLRFEISDLSIDNPQSRYIATNQVPLLITGSAADFSGIRRIEALVSKASVSPITNHQSSVASWQQVMFSGDGIDNDLDNAVDEEEYNRKDDDGDGEIDEDLQGKHGGLPLQSVDWIYKYQPKNDGVYIFNIRAIDNVGHTTAESDFIIVTLDYDTLPPKHLSTAAFKPAFERSEGNGSEYVKYKNGDEIKIVSKWDAEGYKVTADFSEIDSRLAEEGEHRGLPLQDTGDGTYTLQHKINPNNKAPDGMKTARITAVDAASNETVIDKSFTVELDNTLPNFISISAKDKTLSNGITTVLTVTMDASGYTLFADFSKLDSEYTEGAESVTDNGDRTYTVEYTISEKNTKKDTKNALIQFKAFDTAGNAKEYDFSVILNNVAPGIFKVSSQDEDTIYKNGDTINIFIQTDSAGYKVKTDFSFLDSQYEPGAEKTTDRGDGTYIVSYTISEENTKGAEETLENLPVIISVSDERHTSIYDVFTLQLDNQPPTIEISRPSEETLVSTTAQIEIAGKTEAGGVEALFPTIKIAPVPVASSYDAATGEFSFTLDLKRGENRITLQVTDIAGNKTVKELSITYRPIISEIVSAAKGAEIVLPEEVDDGIAYNDTKIIIPAYALPKDAVVSITLFKDTLPLPDGPEIAQDNAVPLAAYHISLKSTSGKDIAGILSKPATLILQFSQSKSTPSDFPLATSAFRWDGVRWNKIGGKAQRNNTVIVKVDNISGLFAIFEISEAPRVFKVYPPRPNPFTPNRDGVNDTVAFFFENPQGLESIIRIYDQRGALVRELTDVGTTSATWNGKDEEGKMLELGLYIYQIKVGAEVKGGTVILAR